MKLYIFYELFYANRERERERDCCVKNFHSALNLILFVYCTNWNIEICKLREIS